MRLIIGLPVAGPIKFSVASRIELKDTFSFFAGLGA